MRVLAEVLALLFGCVLLNGCAHQVLIESEVPGSRVYVDGELLGEAPITSEQRTSTGGRFYLHVEADGYEPADLVVTQSEWFLWPALFAVVPFLGVPLSVPFLLIPIAGPFLAAGVSLSWALLTSPALLSVAFTRKFPERVPVHLRRRSPSDGIAPDLFGVDDGYEMPNPVPLVPPAPEGRGPRQPDGANPVP